MVKGELIIDIFELSDLSIAELPLRSRDENPRSVEIRGIRRYDNFQIRKSLVLRFFQQRDLTPVICGMLHGTGQHES